MHHLGISKLSQFIDREGLREENYGFSYEMLNEMWHELDRLITKYGDEQDQASIELVALLREHQVALDITPSERMSYEELMTYDLAFEPFFADQKDFEVDDDVFTSPYIEDDIRNLKETDFMGPRTRAAYNRMKYGSDKQSQRSSQQRKLEQVENYDFSKLDEYLHQQRLQKMRYSKGMFGV